MVANVAAIRISAGAGCDVHPAPALTTSHLKEPFQTGNNSS